MEKITIAELDTRGIAAPKLDDQLTLAQVADIHEYLGKQRLWLGGHWTAYARETELTTAAFMADPDYSEALGCYSFDTIVRCPHLLEKALHYLDLAEEFFGSEVQLFSANIFWAFPGGPLRPEIQDWHRDFASFDDDRQLAVFFFLTNVNMDAAHGYICGSHRDGTLLPREYEALHFTGPAGTLFVENPYGFHRGKKPSRQCRLMAVARYGVSIPPALDCVEHKQLWDRLDERQRKAVSSIMRG